MNLLIHIMHIQIANKWCLDCDPNQNDRYLDKYMHSGHRKQIITYRIISPYISQVGIFSLRFTKWYSWWWLTR
jgi:hypothetical protein